MSHQDDVRNAPRLFPTAAELGCPPVSPRDADLSRIRVLDRFSPEGQAELRRRAERKARQQQPVVDGELARLVGA